MHWKTTFVFLRTVLVGLSIFISTACTLQTSLEELKSGKDLASVSELAIQPKTASIEAGSQQAFSASGGLPPYNFSIFQGAGQIDSQSGVYISPNAAGTAVIQVMDQLGKKSFAEVTVKVDHFSISPDTKFLAPTNTWSLQPTGGVKPYTYSLLSGTGSVNSTSGFYRAPASAGTDVLQIADSGGNTIQAIVVINPALSIDPATKTLERNASFLFAARDGVGPYTFSKVSGLGSVTSSGTYTAANQDGTAVIRATDSLGNTADAQITISQVLTLSPLSLDLAVTNAYDFTVTGGTGPFTYSLVSGGGTLTPTGHYVADSSSGTATVRVTDSLGATSDGTITIHPALSISPASLSLVVNQSTTFSASGGVGHASFSLVSGIGAITSSGYFVAPSNPGSATIRATDEFGNAQEATVTVSDRLALVPTSKILAVNNTLQFSATGGDGNNTYSLVSGTGTITASGLYTAPATAGTATVRVSDSSGQTAEAVLTVNPALVVSPASMSLAVRNVYTFSSSGGVGTPVFTLVSGSGSITSSGVFTAPATSGTTVIRATDELGNVSDATISIQDELVLSSSPIEMGQGGPYQFHPNGGVGPYTYEILSGGGSVDSSGLFTPPNADGVTWIRVTDSLGNQSENSVTTYSSVQISPSNVQWVVNRTQSFSATGGKAPYAFSVVTGGGAINSTTGFYQAPSTAGTDTVRVTDALGQTSDAVVVVRAALSLSANSSALSVGGSTTLSVSSGASPFSYAVTAGSGSFDSATMTFTAPTTPGVSKVRVTDSDGEVDEVSLQINAGSPTALTFLTTAQTVVSSQCSSIVEIGLQDSYGNSTTAGSSFSVSLSGDNLAFFSDSNCTSSMSSASFASGAVKTHFYFKSSVAGLQTVFASSAGLAGSLQMESIVAGSLQDIRFSPATLTLTAGSCSAATQLRLVDADGNMGIPSSDVSLSLSGAGIKYYSASDCTGSALTTVTLTSTVPSIDLYVTRVLAGSVVGSATASSYGAGSLNLTVSAGPPAKLAFTAIPTTASESNLFNPQPEVRIYDAYDNFISNATNAVTLSAASDSNCSSSASGTLNVSVNPLTASNGIAKFSGVSYSPQSTIYMNASASGLQSACSGAMTVAADYSQSLSFVPANIPHDGLAVAPLLVVPKKNGVALGSGRVIEITASSANVTMTCNGGACSACQTPSSTCVRAYDHGQGAYQIDIKSSSVGTVTFTVKDNVSGTLNDIPGNLTTTFNTANFTTLNVNTTVTSAYQNLNLYLTGGSIVFDSTTVGKAFGDVFVKGATVSHTASTTLAVYKLDISVASLILMSGSINVADKGYPPRYSFGSTAPSTAFTSSGGGQGGSHGGPGGGTFTQTYDDYRDPQYPGAGGGANGYGPGAGIIRISSSKICSISSGASIAATASNTPSGTWTGPGAGGSVKLTCAAFTGSGGSASIAANGGSPADSGTGAGGGGRIALISTNDQSSFAGNFSFPTDDTQITNFYTRVQARGGSGSYNGGPGTIYLKHSGLSYGALLVNNNGLLVYYPTPLPSFKAQITSVSGTTLNLNASFTTGSTDLYKNMRFRADTSATYASASEYLSSAQILTVSSNSLTSVTAAGSPSGLVSGTNLRSVEVLDWVHLTTGVALATDSDLLLLSGDFPTGQMIFTNKILGLSPGAVSLPAIAQINLNSGTFYGSVASAQSISVSGTANVTMTGAVATTNDFSVSAGTLSLTGTLATGRDLSLSGGTNTIESFAVGRDFNMSGGILNHRSTTSTNVYKIEGSVNHNMNLTGGSIDVSARGYTLNSSDQATNYSYGPTGPSTDLGSRRDHFTSCTTNTSGCYSYSTGGSHGGLGGKYSSYAQGPTYDDYRDPSYPGGAAFYSGGGVVRIQVGNLCTIDSGATILANGGTYAGAGGSIKLTCGGFSGTAAAGAVRANGGASVDGVQISSSEYGQYGGGGGGRIALISTGDASSFSGSFAFPSTSGAMTNFLTRVQSRGGTGATKPGGAGTIYLKHSGLTYGGLIVDNNGVGSTETNLPSLSKTTGTVSGSTLPFSAALATGYVDLYKNMRLRPNVNATNGTPGDLLDDNIVTITSNTLSSLTVSGSLTGVPSGATLRTLEVLDYLYVTGSSKLTTSSDLVVLSGNFMSPTLDLNNAIVEMQGGASSYPSANMTLSSGTYSSAGLVADSLVISGATLSCTGAVSSNNLTVSSGTYSAVTTSVGNDFLVTGGTVTSYSNTVSRDLGISGGSNTMESLTVGRDFNMSGGSLTHRASTSTAVYRMNATVSNNFNFTGGSINVSGKGYVYNSADRYTNYSFGSGAPSTALGAGRDIWTTTCSTNTSSCYSYSSGGSHGGVGGKYSSYAQGSTYDDFKDPFYPGGAGYRSGGGVVRIQATNTCTIDSGATINANGDTYAGAGGSIKLDCGAFAGTAGAGALTANGGASVDGVQLGAWEYAQYGGGGGGRIALISSGDGLSLGGNFSLPTDATSMSNFLNRVQARGGTGATKPGGAGTIFVKHNGMSYGGLIISNNGVVNGVTKALSTTANSNKINSKTDSNTLKVTSASTPFTNMVDLYKGSLLHIWPVTGGFDDPMSATHLASVLTANGTNTFVSTGSPYASASISADNYNYRITYQLDSLYIGEKAIFDLQSADLILVQSDSSLACDFVSTTGNQFSVSAGSVLQGGNSYSSTACPDSNISTKGSTVIFTRYCDGAGNCH